MACILFVQRDSSSPPFQKQGAEEEEEEEERCPPIEEMQICNFWGLSLASLSRHVVCITKLLT
jgi:hypothetical protein